MRACRTRAAKAARYSLGVTRRFLGVVIAAPLRVLAIANFRITEPTNIKRHTLLSFIKKVNGVWTAKMGLSSQSLCDCMGRHHDLDLTLGVSVGLFLSEKQSYRKAGELKAMDTNRVLIIAAAVVLALILVWYVLPTSTPTDGPMLTPPAAAPQPQ